ncbi:MAG: ABC transporter ATP-binding protein/permease [Planctomycetes bacterium]|nr:ABC transporter ATP-binding protein/permease [Planctomycetota bacterium]
MKALGHLKPYFRRYQRPYLLGVLFIALSTAFMVFGPRLVQKALDSLEQGVDLAYLGWCTAGLMGVTLIRAFFLFLTRRVMIFASRRVENDLRNDFFRHLQTLSPGFFHANPTGDLMAVATNDLAAVRQVLGPGIMYSVSTICAFAFITVNLLLISPLLTLLAMGILPLMAFTVYRFGKAIHWRFEKIQEQFGTLTSRMQENLAGVRVIRSYAQEAYEESRFETTNREYVNRNRGYVLVQSAFRPSLTAIMGLGTAVMLLIGGQMIVDGVITIGAFTAFSIYLTQLMWPAVAIGWVTGLFQRGAASMKRFQRIVETMPIIRNEKEARALLEPEGRIELRDLSFRYTPEGPEVLKGITTTVEPGTTVALIGATGSGKSTLLNLLARLYPVKRGRIFIDGRDINDIELASLRDLYGFVPQEAFLFSDTIGHNIAFANPEASPEAIKSAADLASIGSQIHEFPKAFDTMLGEKGINLSGGQKQRTAIARAVLKDPKILIFDDALSSVDTRTEEEILGNLHRFARGRTLLLVAHRISTVRRADRILVLKEGSIVEEGTHDLLIRKGGLYADLEKQQRLKSEIEEL